MDEKDYIVTTKNILCDERCTRHSIKDCLDCGRYMTTIDEKEEMSESQIYNMIDIGNCYITNVKKIK